GRQRHMLFFSRRLPGNSFRVKQVSAAETAAPTNTSSTVTRPFSTIQRINSSRNNRTSLLLAQIVRYRQSKGYQIVWSGALTHNVFFIITELRDNLPTSSRPYRPSGQVPPRSSLACPLRQLRVWSSVSSTNRLFSPLPASRLF